MRYPKIINEISSNNWAITESAFKGILSVIDDDFDSDDYKVFHLISEANQKALVSNLGEQVEDSRYSFIKGNIGILNVNGPIVPRATALAEASGLTSIERLTKEFLAFEENEKIEKILLLFDTPGGAITGVSEFAQLVNSSEKETISFVYGMAASAGYWIASAADKVFSVSTGILGSIGVIFSTRISDDKDVIEIVSSQSPYKRVNLKTKEGKKKVQVLLDDLADVFINDVAKYRSVNKEKVLKDFGKGDVMAADKAAKVDMIDGITTLNMLTAVASAKKDIDLIVTGELVHENAVIDDKIFITGTPPFKDFSIVDKPWDANAAIKRVRQKTDSIGKPSGSYKNAFFWYDPKNEDNFGAYKLPFTDIVDGKQVAIRRGVFAANAAMKGARGGVNIPAKDRPAVQAHIDRYVNKIRKQDEQKKSSNERSIVKMSTLHELFADYPNLKDEVETIKKDSYDSGKKEVENRIAAATPILESDSYPNSIKKVAIEVLNGKVSADVLKGSLIAYDAMRENEKAKKAQDESEEVGDTDGSLDHESISEDGTISNEDEVNEAIAKLKVG